MTILDLAAFRTMAYECPCCSVTLMSDDNGTRALCGDCQRADCSPNGEGCYDDCQRPCPSCGDPRSADYYVCVIFIDGDGETTYTDFYVCGDHLLDESDVAGGYVASSATVLGYTVSELPR